ncbi:MAG TPA: histidine kinase dimerization/phospho-acceptor domain-containing protein, partial [Myxococcaceae bacterium]|nr:histidine kinase dimerization/phospho-acceptor domain-containing protein [Myxococcaceae bacterium]
MTATPLDSPSALRQKSLADALFTRLMDENYRKTSRVFAVLMAVQWAAAILVAAVWSPYGWAGKAQSVHPHLLVALFLGGALSGMPILLALKMPTAPLTRHAIATSQMLWSALLIHLTGGRIETHFHVFVSLAFVAFFRDWKVLVTATGMVIGDHVLRGLFWPESVYGSSSPEWWRFAEHASWVVFEDVILVLACIRGVAEVRAISEQQAQNQVATEAELTRTEKLAAIGQLAASVAHELRNPLGAVRNGVAYISKRVLNPNVSVEVLQADKRLPQFFGVIEHELNECARIISDLLDFARERPPERRETPIGPLAEAAIGLVPARANVELVNQVPDSLPVPNLDTDQFRQVLANVVQNAAEAIPADRQGRVTVSASGGGFEAWVITVSDDGVGMKPEV